ncbi:MAG: OmpA family protein [Sedimentisphaerales bacterium]|nr:OmpA family protein [Sedimentisphaerales bacterium]
MARKKKPKLEGAPEYMVTYGDMMTLLLCFFVILVSMSEMKQDQKFQKVAESMKRAFGYQGGAGFITGQIPPTNTLEKRLTHLLIRKFRLQIGKSSDEGIEGENPSVQTVREGLEFTIGGQVSFEPGKAVLLDAAKKQLGLFAETIMGMNNKIRIQGHTARIPPNLYQPFNTLDDLSYARGMAVKDYLISKGLREQRIAVEVCGDNEPIRTQAYDTNSRTANDRVSIIVTENLIEEYLGSPEKETENILEG